MSGVNAADDGTDSPRGHADDEAAAPYVHKVVAPPKQRLLKELRFGLKETFFHDEPLRPFKDQSWLRRVVLGVEAVFPIVKWGRSYELSMFKGDLIAGLTIATLCIPQVFI